MFDQSKSVFRAYRATTDLAEARVKFWKQTPEAALEAKKLIDAFADSVRIKGDSLNLKLSTQKDLLALLDDSSIRLGWIIDGGQLRTPELQAKAKDILVIQERVTRSILFKHGHLRFYGSGGQFGISTSSRPLKMPRWLKGIIDPGKRVPTPMHRSAADFALAAAEFEANSSGPPDLIRMKPSSSDPGRVYAWIDARSQVIQALSGLGLIDQTLSRSPGQVLE